MRSSIYSLLFCLCLLILPVGAFAIDSTQLTDVIKSNGTGNINLFKDVTNVDLEAFRVANAGKLVLAVDVNEAADGTEKSSSQAVTFKSLLLEITINGTVYTYSEFTTETQALVAEAPGIDRQLYYTAIGDSGSNRITANNIFQQKYDSTITIPVSEDLSQATQALLTIILLTTNTSLGDPEAFYDFSNGFEDLALLNTTDAQFIDDLSPGHIEAPAIILTNPEPTNTVVSQTYYPSSTSYYLVAYEDKFPSRGDYDFNDLTVAYQLTLNFDVNDEVVSIAGVAYLVTRGAEYNHDWYLNIGIPIGTSGTLNYTLTPPAGSNSNVISNSNAFNDELRIRAFPETKFVFRDPTYTMVNTLLEQALILGPKFEFIATFDSPVQASAIASAPFDPYLYVYNTDFEIHLPGQSPSANSRNILDNISGFKDENGFPFAMLMPDNWEPPLEKTEMLEAYPAFSDFVTSTGNRSKNWYSTPVENKIKRISGVNWKW